MNQPNYFLDICFLQISFLTWIFLVFSMRQIQLELNKHNKYKRMIKIILLALVAASFAFEIEKQASSLQLENAPWLIASVQSGKFMYIQSSKFIIPNEACFKRLFLDNAATYIDNEIIKNIPTGGAISENSQLAEAIDDDQKIWLLTNGEKWRISSIDHFNKFGFDSSKITKCQPSYLDLFKTGINI